MDFLTEPPAPFDEVALAEESRASADAPEALRSYVEHGKNAFLGTRGGKRSTELKAARTSYRDE